MFNYYSQNLLSATRKANYNRKDIIIETLKWILFLDIASRYRYNKYIGKKYDLPRVIPHYCGNCWRNIYIMCCEGNLNDRNITLGRLKQNPRTKIMGTFNLCIRRHVTQSAIIVNSGHNMHFIHHRPTYDIVPKL